MPDPGLSDGALHATGTGPRHPGFSAPSGDRRQARIERDRLESRVREALSAGSLLITAGAGYGKTTILEQALRDEPQLVWLSMTTADRDPGVLVLRLVEGISRVVPGAAGEVGEKLAMATVPIDPLAAAWALADDLERVLTRPLVLVVDDAENLEGAPAAIELLSALIRAEKGFVRVALAGRRSLGVRVAKTRAAGAVVELTAADLAFSPAECADVLGARAIQPSSEQVDAVLASTEGWPLGVNLLAATATDGGVAATSLRSREAVKAFFAEEVLDGLEPGLRRAVIDASVTSELTPAVAAALGLPPDLFDQLERIGIAIRGHSQNGTRHYHPLLREFLLERLADESAPAAIRELHRRVAPVAAEAGRMVDAIEHWLDAEDWPIAADTLAAHGAGLVHSSPALVRGLVERLPAEPRALPGIVLLEVQLALGRGDHQLAADLARTAIFALQEEGDVTREWLARYLHTEALYHLGEFAAAAEWAAGFDDPEAREAYIFGPAVGSATAVCLASDGDFAASDRIAEAVRGHPEGALVSAADAIRMAYMDFPRGQIQASIDRMVASLAELEQADPFGLRLYTMSWLGFMLEESGRIEEVLAIADDLANQADGGRAPFMVLHARNWRAQQNASAGRLRDAEADLARGGPATPGWLGYDWELANAAVAGLRGDHLDACAAAERSLLQVRTGSVVFRFWAAADLVPVFVEAGRSARALEVVEETLGMLAEKMPGADGRFLRARMHALRAWLLDLAGDNSGADADLLAAWADAGEEMTLILRRQWQWLEPAVSSALERGVLDVARVVGALTAAAPPGGALTRLTAHPLAAVRRAALEPAVASGDPEAFRRLAELDADPDPQVADAARRQARTLARSAPPLRFRLLGGFSMRRGGWRARDADWGRPAAARLVRFLLVNRGEASPEDAVCEQLWPELTGDSARNSLRVAASRARKVLDLPGAEVSAIEVSEGCYSLVLGPRDSVDAEEFEAAATVAFDASADRRRAALERARSLWGGEPLAVERYADWASAWRERLVDRQIGVLTSLGHILLDAGDHSAAISTARELVALDDLNESGQRLLITAYARAGRTGQALHQYLVCRRALVEALGTEPAAETTELQARVLAGDTV